MKNEHIYREIFIDNTIQLVAEGGFEMATTRAISGYRKEIRNVKLNEAHIYRVFETKEKLFAETFKKLDDEVLSVIKTALAEFDTDKDARSQYEALFFRFWRFLLQNEAKCKYYTRYYHSVYFKNGVYAAHKKNFEAMIEKITPAFVFGADVWSIFHHVLTALLNFAVRVYNGELENSDENTYHIFNVVYSVIGLYLKK